MCICSLLEVVVLIHRSSDQVYYRICFVLIPIRGDHAGDKIPLEMVCHALRDNVVHMLVVSGRGVVIGLNESRLMFVVCLLELGY